MKQLDREMQKKKLFLLDIDGTIGFDGKLFEGAMEFFQEVLRQKGKYVFITNNSTTSIADYVLKYKKIGLEVDETNFITSSYASILYLKKEFGSQKLFAAGTKSFINELKAAGLRVTEEVEEDVVAVVVGFDNELTYQKVFRVCEILQTKNAAFIATNPDLVCPVGFGFIPDCGAICNMIENAVKRKPIYIGKPNPVIVEMAMKTFNASAHETVVIGDRLYTDIACGINAGVDTVAVFSGEVKKEDLEDTSYKPAFYCDSIKDIYESLRKI
ncbi:HAD-IIA family hydrolase [Anaeromicropila populeti]|uniref:Acid sugar phosphatase n=1 Tax=Anaeromicropila populeti TaxID=37658 RepID=A0A1I6HRX4_9FIRM|nr:HAD-IIA family hydrolase [Anaeromicropila populeti]SFR57173.1 Haloacid Dehalogenase Superfamily Class (subfamily) IIA [Anaeromicropila populeti]